MINEINAPWTTVKIIHALREQSRNSFKGLGRSPEELIEKFAEEEMTEIADEYVFGGK